MAEKQAIFSNTRFSVVAEVIEGTPVVEPAGAGVALSMEGAEFDISRETLESPYMTEGLDKTPPTPSMNSDDLGLPTLPVYVRSGTGVKPDFSIMMESLIGKEEIPTDGTVDTASTTTVIQIASGASDFVEGQQVYFPDQAFMSRVIETDVAGELGIWPPLPATPTPADVIKAGVHWMLDSEAYPFFTGYAYFDGPKRLRYTSCKATSGEFTFEVGQYVPINFTVAALDYLPDYTAQAVDPGTDFETKPMTCLDVALSATYAGIASGTPTTAETIITAPAFEVAIGDKLLADVGSGVWETVNISAVSGNAGTGQSITITHDALSAAVSAEDIVYIRRLKCAGVGDTLTISIENGVEPRNCMAASRGKVGRVKTARTVNISKTPYFMSWQEVYLRDGIVSAELVATLKDIDDNVFSFFIPNMVNTEVNLNSDTQMKLDVTAGAFLDPVLGQDHSIVISQFKA